MEMMSGEAIFEQVVSGGIHADTQVESSSVSLTVAGILRAGGPGQLDFGGGELQLAEREPLEPEKRDPDDDYGWWELGPGTYLMECNENLDLQPGQWALLSPHDHLLWNGLHHPTLTLGEDDSSVRLTYPLQVHDAGTAIKENARVSVLRVFQSEVG